MDQYGEGSLVFYGASRSRKINYNGSLRDYLKELGLDALQVRDRDASPEDVMRTLSKRRARYSVRGESVVISLVEVATQRTLMSYDIVRTTKRRSAEIGKEVVGHVTLHPATARLTVESSDDVLSTLHDADRIEEFCAALYQDFAAAPHTINPSSAAWIARKVLDHLGAVALKVNARSGSSYWMPAEGVDKAREFFSGLGWEFLAVPVDMSEELAAAIEGSRSERSAA